VTALGHAQHLALVGQRPGLLAAGRAAEHVADLPQPHPGVPAGGVRGQRLHQPGEERRAQDRLLGHERVGDLDAVAGQAATLEVTGGEE
jgi:hypothetical protein